MLQSLAEATKATEVAQSLSTSQVLPPPLSQATNNHNPGSLEPAGAQTAGKGLVGWLLSSPQVRGAWHGAVWAEGGGRGGCGDSDKESWGVPGEIHLETWLKGN